MIMEIKELEQGNMVNYRSKSVDMGSNINPFGLSVNVNGILVSALIGWIISISFYC